MRASGHRHVSRSPASARHPAATLAVLVVAVAALGASGVAVVSLDEQAPHQGSTASAEPAFGSPPSRSRPSEPGPEVATWREVVRALVARRSFAWHRGDPTLLDSVYVAGSTVESRDRRMMRAYAARGLDVRGARLRLGSVTERSRTRGVVRIQLVDRLGPTTAVGTSGQRYSLPRDLPSRHVLVLRRVGGAWRIANIRLG